MSLVGFVTTSMFTISLIINISNSIKDSSLSNRMLEIPAVRNILNGSKNVGSHFKWGLANTYLPHVELHHFDIGVDVVTFGEEQSVD